MKTKTFLLFTVLISLAQSISQYDFNACRISNCNAEETNCLSDQSGCLNYFAIMRTWYLGIYIVSPPVETVKIGTPVGAAAKIQLLGLILTT
jgi:hypothetical protein